MASIIQTVSGAITPVEAGVTMAHEHVLVDQWGVGGGYDGILDDEELAVDELSAYLGAGGRTVVDCTNEGLGRDPEVVARIAARSGVQVVMGSGWYRERVYPAAIAGVDPDGLAAILEREIVEGVAGTGIRPGIIGEIGTERYRISPAEERVFRGAARAQLRTGIGIWTHTTHGGDLALEQIELLRSEGVPADRIVVCHMGDRIGYRHLDPIARTGVYLSVDNTGYVGGGYPADDVRADNVAALVAAGHGSRVLLGGDVCTKSALVAYGGKGYAHILVRFLPLLRARGVGEDAIRGLIADNPARALAFEPAWA